MLIHEACLLSAEIGDNRLWPSRLQLCPTFINALLRQRNWVKNIMACKQAIVVKAQLMDLIRRGKRCNSEIVYIKESLILLAAVN